MLRSLSGRSDLIQVRDLDKAVIQIAQIPVRMPTSLSGFGGNTMLPETMHLTSNRRYLASSLSGGSTNVLYDMTEKKEILRTKDYISISRFTPDGQTLVFLPEVWYQAPEAIWYRLENGTWSESASRILPLEKGENIQQACDRFFVTIRKENTKRAWLKRLMISSRTR